jgi:hypothetical protein
VEKKSINDEGFRDLLREFDGMEAKCITALTEKKNESLT